MSKVKQLSTKQKILLANSALFLILVYFIGAVYFQSHFVPNTYIGKINIAQLKPEEVGEKIEKEFNQSQIIFTENDKEVGYIQLNQLGIRYKDDSLLREQLEKQKASIWPVYLFKTTKCDALKAVEMNNDGLIALVNSLEIKNDNPIESKNAQIVKNSQGKFSVVDEVYGNVINAKSIKDSIIESLSKSSNIVKLEESYEKPSVTKESKELQDKFKHLEKLTNAKIVLKLSGEEIPIESERITSWLNINESGDITVDQEKVNDYLDELNKNYSPRYQARDFESTYSGWVSVQPGTYGWYIDRDEEVPILSQIILEGKDVDHEPVIGGQGYGETGFGSSYVEVDIAHQMMSIYKAGELVLQTPIVTGKIGAETVPGAYVVWEKAQGANLAGYDPVRQSDYVQPVNYWIAFDDNGQGIHDANWQPTFGGTAYLSAGSLGCINTPPNIMPEVFEIVDYGMPVIIF